MAQPVKASQLHEEPINALFYGGVGVGKTHLLRSLGPDGAIVSTGEGLATLHGLNDAESPDIFQVRESPIDAKTGIFKEAKGFDDVTVVLDEIIAGKHGRYTKIALDDATFFSKLARNKAVEMNMQTNKSKTLSEARSTGVLNMSVQDYGAEMNVIDWFLFTYIPIFREHGIHFFLIAHEKISYNKPERIGDPATIRSIGPAFTGQSFVDQVTAYFDLVWHVTRRSRLDKGKPVIESAYRTETNGIITAKTRYRGAFKDVIVNPTIPEIIALCHSGNTPTNQA